uniref:Uncharacterized protein n=1 Tax=Campanula takesimana TaxID=989334 RepID=A0A7M3UZN2_9ASTR|nr:hypothetical protein [Campanula takesimana]
MKEVDPPSFFHGTTLFPPSHLSTRFTEKKCKTGCSARKKGLTKPGSLTKTNLI